MATDFLYSDAPRCQKSGMTVHAHAGEVSGKTARLERQGNTPSGGLVSMQAPVFGDAKSRVTE